MGSVGARVLDQKSAVIVPHDQPQHQQQQQQQQQQKQQNQEALRCPRCDSSNTKFCYYNNYSLSQPRHFCKACKRYWTRGGTLRNVPVGGGCRKNKRLKRPSNNNFISSTSSTSNSSLTNSTTNSAASSGGNNNTTNIHELISSASNNHHHGLNPLFYHGLPTDNLNFPFSRYDLQNPPQIQSLGLGFSSSTINGDMGYNHHHHPPPPKQIFQDLISSNPLLSTSTTTSSCSSPSISSLLASSLQIKGGNNYHHQALLMPNSYHEEDHDDTTNLQMKGVVGGSNNGMYNMKEVKMDLEGQNRSNMHHWSISNNNTTTTNTNANATPNHQNHMDHQTINPSSSSDPSLLWGGNAWLDPSNNLGSSVPSLI